MPGGTADGDVESKAGCSGFTAWLIGGFSVDRNPTVRPAQPTGMLQPVYIDVVQLKMVENSSIHPLAPTNTQYRYSNVALTFLRKHVLRRKR